MEQNGRKISTNTKNCICSILGSNPLIEQVPAKLQDNLQDTQFGNNLKAFIVYLYYVGRVTEHKIKLLNIRLKIY